MIFRILGAASLALGLMAGVASAATLENVKGSVFVDHGQGFIPFGGGTVKTGDQVRVRAGSASINYGGGVVIPVRAGQTVRVSAVFGADLGPERRPQTSGISDPTALAIGAALSVGIACIGFCRDDDERTFIASP